MKKYILMSICLVLCLASLCVLKSNEDVKLVKVNTEALSNNKICWGLRKSTKSRATRFRK